MAVTSYGVNNALAVKLYAKKLDVEVLKETEIADYIGTDNNSLWQMKTETQKSAGDQITYGLRMQLSGPGVSGDGTLEGNEEALTTYSDALLIDQLRHAVRSAGKMSEQRVPFSVRDEALAGLKDWWVDRIAVSAFNHLCGYTVQTDTRYTGGNAVVAPTAARHIWSSASHTTDQSLTSGEVLTLSQIDRCVTLAETLTPPIRPVMIKGKKHYVMFIHPYDLYNLRHDASTAGNWFDIQKAAMQGGDVTGNPLFSGAVGMYNNTIIRVDSRITQGVHSASSTTAVAAVRRSVFCGAQSLVLGFGQDNGPNKFNWVEELFDFKNQLGVSAGCIWGTKKTIFNSTDFATIVVSSYAVAP